jgi:hypothetical protein
MQTDNGAYTSTLKDSCETDNQEFTFCTVGGCQQNGITKWHVGVMTQTAHTILLHAMAKTGMVTILAICDQTCIHFSQCINQM